MGYRDKVRDNIDEMMKHADAAKAEMQFGSTWKLDELCMNLISVQLAATEALSEIYRSCGPFFKPPTSVSAQTERPGVLLENAGSGERLFVPTTRKKRA